MSSAQKIFDSVNAILLLNPTISQRLKRATCGLIFLGLLPLISVAQSGSGELRLRVQDPEGLPMQSLVEVVSDSNQVHDSSPTDSLGRLLRRNLPYGVYLIRITHPGFAVFSKKIQITSQVMVEIQATLVIEPTQSNVLVTDSQTLVDPDATGVVTRLGLSSVEQRPTSLAGRSLIDLVASQPGWILESNGSLHPRGSEYQVQYIVDGIPFTENRSPAFSAGMDADDVQSVAVLTGNFPAEYGRKLGGVVEVTTKTQPLEGWHGQLAASGGSFDSAAGSAAVSYGWGKNAVNLGGEEVSTSRYLDPPVLQSFTNHGVSAGETFQYQRDLGGGDRAIFSLNHRRTGFQVPNELLQEDAGQRQDRGNSETTGTAAYEYVISPNAFADFRVMARDVTATLSSNPLSTPILAGQQRGFREAYAKTTFSLHHGIHNLKAGIELDYARMHEHFAYTLSDPSFFDPGTPANFRFSGRGTDREQALFVQDLLHLGRFSISAGLRYDHYQLLVSRWGLSPRLGIGWYWPRAALNLHASFDRVFQTPASENILLSSSDAVQHLSPHALSLPLLPSTGTYWDAGITKALFGSMKLDLDGYRRSLNNFADDDLLLNTGVTFPISFRKSQIYGSDAKLTLPHWNRLSAFISYSYMVGFAYSPVTGGLFLDTDQAGILGFTRFPVTQDQRNTLMARAAVQLTPRVWTAFSASYGSGLPAEFEGTQQDAIQQYGDAIVQRLNFVRGRVRPDLALGVSLGANLLTTDVFTLRMQADGENLNNRINVINFAGLFSRTGIAPPRSYALRLQAIF